MVKESLSISKDMFIFACNHWLTVNRSNVTIMELNSCKSHGLGRINGILSAHPHVINMVYFSNKEQLLLIYHKPNVPEGES